MNLGMKLCKNHIICSQLTIINDFLKMIKDKQLLDDNLKKIIDFISVDKARNFVLGIDDFFCFRNKVCVLTK